eukprot:2246438-Rhodomonas_salina.3
MPSHQYQPAYAATRAAGPPHQYQKPYATTDATTSTMELRTSYGTTCCSVEEGGVPFIEREGVEMR